MININTLIKISKINTITIAFMTESHEYIAFTEGFIWKHTRIY